MHDEKIIKKIGKIWQQVWIYTAVMYLCYVQTFMLFPGISIDKINLDPILSKEWKVVLLVLTFNVFDSLGKFAHNVWEQSTELRYLLIVLVARNIFFFFFFKILAETRKYVPNGNDNSLWSNGGVAFACMGVFALLNGFLTSGTSTLAP